MTARAPTPRSRDRRRRRGPRRLLDAARSNSACEHADPGRALRVFSIAAAGEFATRLNIRNVATDVSVLLVLAVGMTFVIVTAGIDLSVGSVLVFSGVVAGQADGGGRRRRLAA